MRSRISLAGCLVWTLFVLANLVISGHWSFWLAASIIPPIAFLVGAMLATGLALILGVGLVRRWAVAAGVLGLLLALPQSGLNPGALIHRTPPSGSAPELRVVSWNTEYWDQTDSADHFYRYLVGMHADVYLLQEYMQIVRGKVAPVDDLGELRRRFPGYQIFVQGQLVTMVRFPVIGRSRAVAPDVMRVDVDVPAVGTVSLYNIHMPNQFEPGAGPFSAAFYTSFERDSQARHREYHSLVNDLTANPNPAALAGDFNTSPAMAEIRQVGKVADDGVGAMHSFYPRSWGQHFPSPLRAWRLDWAFTRHASITSYRFVDPQGMSDHSLQRFTVRLAPTS